MVYEGNETRASPLGKATGMLLRHTAKHAVAGGSPSIGSSLQKRSGLEDISLPMNSWQRCPTVSVEGIGGMARKAKHGDPEFRQPDTKHKSNCS